MSASTAALATFARSLNALSGVPARASRKAAEGIQRLVDHEFDAGSDPYGRPWKGLRPATIAKGRTPPPLTDSGALAGGTEVRAARGAGIQVEVGESYGAFHQTGTRYMAARPILPTGPLPKAWQAEIDLALADAFKATLGGR